MHGVTSRNKQNEICDYRIPEFDHISNSQSSARSFCRSRILGIFVQVEKPKKIYGKVVHTGICISAVDGCFYKWFR